MMFLPVAIFFITFRYVPMGGLIVAFKDYNFVDGVLGSPWVGFENMRLLFSNPQTLQIIKNTLVLSLISVFVGFPFPIILAILLNEARIMIFKRSIQTLVYLPHFLSWVIVGGLFITIFGQESGIVNRLLEQWTGTTFAFLYNEFSWMSIFAGSGIWKNAGWSAIIYLAALSSIDPSLYESASIDGAGKFRKIWHITLPGISSIVVLMFILAMGNVMEVGFDHVFVLQNAVVSSISEVISTYSYKIGIRGAEFSLTAALGLFESLVGLVLVIVTNQIARKFNKSLW
jgi:putative aldouronate transport system permease protein